MNINRHISSKLFQRRKLSKIRPVRSHFATSKWGDTNVNINKFRVSIPIFLIFVFLLTCFAGAALCPDVAKAELVFSCSAENDLYRIMTSTGEKYPRFSDPLKAVEAASPGSGVLILADQYPKTPTPISAEVYEKAKQNKLRVYVEYPSQVPGVTVDKPRAPHWERTVVASDAFMPDLEKLRILQLHDCHVLPIKADSASLKPADLVLARVAGYDTAVYGLSEESTPMLLHHGEDEILIATSKLSQFVTARYGPASAWTPIWNHILAWLSPSEKIELPVWTPSVRPSFAKNEKLPADAEHQSLQRGLEWFRGFLLNEPWDEYNKRQTGPQIGVSIAAPEKEESEPTGDGRFGILEGHISKIRLDGSQPLRNLLRGDCNTESAMALALGALSEKKDDYAKIAENLMDYVYVNSDMYQGPPNKPSDGFYGLLGWHTGGVGPNVYWGNDGSKSLVSTMVAGAALKSDRWNDALVAGILGNFRTAGPEGFRAGSPLRKEALTKVGWERYAHRRSITPWPQREGWAWACYLWLYDKTGYEPLLTQARKALRLTMENYPKYWRCSLHEMQMERGRILLPLAWLVRVDDTPEHRRWLYRIIDDMVARMDESGGIQEEMIATSLTSNKDYGTCEVSILHRDGDLCVDVFYSMAPAFLGMHEAAAATGDKRLSELSDRMAKFLIRVQAKSEDHPDLDGGWFRTFNYKSWEYWGANGDHGWGAWCTETGWLQSHVVATMAARRLGTSLWDLTHDSKVDEIFARYRREMEIDKAVQIWASTPPMDCQHIGLGRVPYLSQAPDHRHPGKGAQGLVDAQLGSPTKIDSRWCGFRGIPFEATVNMDEVTLVRYIGGHFLNDVANGIYFPTRIEVSAFKDGEFHVVGTLDIDPATSDKTSTAKEFGVHLTDCMTNQIRLRAVGRKVLPENHPAAGRPAWLFVDEVIVH